MIPPFECNTSNNVNTVYHSAQSIFLCCLPSPWKVIDVLLQAVFNFTFWSCLSLSVYMYTDSCCTASLTTFITLAYCIYLPCLYLTSPALLSHWSAICSVSFLICSVLSNVLALFVIVFVYALLFCVLYIFMLQIFIVYIIYTIAAVHLMIKPLDLCR